MRSALALALLVAACGKAPPPPPPEPRASEAAPRAAAILVPGEYRLAGADGQDVNLGHTITVSVTQDEIRAASQCVTPRWRYRQEAERLVTQIIPEAICDRGRYPAEEALSAVFDDPQSVARTPENGIAIEGGGHVIILFSQ